MLPPAPGLFSTTTGCPNAVDSFCPMIRASVSVLPPGAKGTTYVIGWLGHVSGAAAYDTVPIAANAIALIDASKYFLNVIEFSFWTTALDRHTCCTVEYRPQVPWTESY